MDTTGELATEYLGDVIQRDQGILELETDKATVEVPSDQAGRVTAIHVSEGESVPIGAALLTLETEVQAPAAEPPGPAAPEPAAPAATPEPEAKATPQTPPSAPLPPSPSAVEATGPVESASHPPVERPPFDRP